MATSKNARFWVWFHNSPVKLTLKPGKTLSYASGGATDEGWHSESEQFWHEGDVIVRERVSDGCDCDGRLTTTSEYICPLSDLAENFVEEDNLAYPEWIRKNSCQYDEFARTMGY